MPQQYCDYTDRIETDSGETSSLLLDCKERGGVTITNYTGNCCQTVVSSCCSLDEGCQEILCEAQSDMCNKTCCDPTETCVSDSICCPSSKLCNNNTLCCGNGESCVNGTECCPTANICGNECCGTGECCDTELNQCCTGGCPTEEECKNKGQCRHKDAGGCAYCSECTCEEKGGNLAGPFVA